MKPRKIVSIDPDKCDGCGLCASACAEGAIEVRAGKARLLRDSYCDGLGACLPACPRDAIRIEKRKADAFDEQAVKGHLERRARTADLPCECPGSASRVITTAASAKRRPDPDLLPPSALGQWPVQLRLVPPSAPYLKGADLLVCADCVPFAVPDFHSRYLSGHAVLVGCPKLDDLDFYFEKLQDILRHANPRSITVLRMAVPCCGGIAQATREAHARTSPGTPLQIHTIGIGNNAVSREIVTSGAVGSRS